MARVSGEVVSLNDQEVGIFGFGSLLYLNSLERTLGRRYDNPSLPCTVNGWRRRWNITEPNDAIYAVSPTGRYYPKRIMYLNIEQQAHQLLNGLLIFISKKNLPALDRRENVYNRIEITSQINEFQIKGGPIYTYEGKPDYMVEQVSSPRDAAIQQSYLDTIEKAMQQLGPSFRRQYEASTDAVPQRLVIRDRRAR